MAGVSPVTTPATFPATIPATFLDDFAPDMKFSRLGGLALVSSVFHRLY